MAYNATKNSVSNRGVPPDSFLDELVAWGRIAPGEVFLPSSNKDIYSNVFAALGPWQGLRHRRAVMLEVMRVLAGFESSWNWNQGKNTTSTAPAAIEAGAWQVKCGLVGVWAGAQGSCAHPGRLAEGERFPTGHEAESSARDGVYRPLTAPNVDHNGPVKRHEIDPWIRKDAVMEFQDLVYPATRAGAVAICVGI
jgi:hypothetical protein